MSTPLPHLAPRVPDTLNILTSLHIPSLHIFKSLYILLTLLGKLFLPHVCVETAKYPLMLYLNNWPFVEYSLSFPGV